MNKPNAPGEGSELPATLADYLKEIGIEGGIEASRIESLRQERLWNVCEILFKHLKAALSSPQQESAEDAWNRAMLVAEKASGFNYDLSYLFPYVAPPVTAEGKDRP